MISNRELVVHLFAPIAGPGAEDAYRYLCRVWEGCRRELGMDQPIPATECAATPPGGAAVAQAGSSATLAACRRPGPGVFQAVLRRHHDVVCLAAALAPPAARGTTAGGGTSWAELDRRWSQTAGPAPQALVGAARLHLARLADPDPQRVDADADLARTFAADLPADVLTEGWETRGAATTSGFAVWEVADVPEDRLERRVVVVAPAGAGPRLSAWVWSRGTAEITPFGRYLLHAAKIRYLLRVWDGGRVARELRPRLDETADELTRLLDTDGAGRGREAERAAADGAEEADGADDLTARLRAGEARLTGVSTRLGQMRLSAEIARGNMDETLRCGGPREGATGLFADDAGLVDWFIGQLADDRAYLEESLERARRTLVIADAQGGRQGVIRAAGVGDAASAAAGRVADGFPYDVSITDGDRRTLLDALANAFGSDGAAAPILDRIGLEPRFRHSFRTGTPLDAWRQMLADMCNGRLDAPHRRLIEAGLHEFPFNQTFRDLARRYDLPGRRG
jgi:hypothetical protein